MKEIVRKVLPDSMILKYRDAKEHIRVKKEFYQAAKRYNDATNFHDVGSSDEGVKALLIYHTHAIEKGLSHTKFRSNFGERALIGLKSNLDQFNKLNLDQDDFAFQNAKSVLKAYKKRHVEQNLTTPFFDSLFDDKKINNASEIAGIKTHLDKRTNKMNFEELESFRTTQREFLSRKVDLKDFQKAVNIAMKTPSVCNRQPWKIYETDNKNKIEELLQLQGGFRGYEIPPTLSLITVDQQAFIGVPERNEAYIDGGLFLMNFDLALTHVGVASCILNAMLPNQQLDNIRKILSIPVSEVLIAFIAAGYPKKQIAAAKSARKSVNDVLNIVR